MSSNNNLPTGSPWGSPEERQQWDKYYKQARLARLKAERKAQHDKEGENVSYSCHKVTANIIFRRGGRGGLQGPPIYCWTMWYHTTRAFQETTCTEETVWCGKCSETPSRWNAYNVLYIGHSTLIFYLSEIFHSTLIFLTLENPLAKQATQDVEMEEVEKPKQAFWTPEEAKEFWKTKAEKKAEEGAEGASAHMEMSQNVGRVEDSTTN